MLIREQKRELDKQETETNSKRPKETEAMCVCVCKSDFYVFIQLLDAFLRVHCFDYIHRNTEEFFFAKRFAQRNREKEKKCHRLELV